MKKVIRFFDALSNICDKVGIVIICITGFGILVSMLCGVFSRVFLEFAFIWPEETSRYLLIWTTFVGSSVALKRGELVRFEFILNLFKSKKSERIVELVGRFFLLAFLIAFLIIGTEAIPIYSKSRAVGLPITLIYPASGLFVGGSFMLIHTIDNILNDIAFLFKKEVA